ncbi:MAG: DUF72 domain-containing protein [Gemmatimonadetes bacterium]|nr:DUF72 domain-containing protein [Gemmatimonadota bacterium]
MPNGTLRVGTSGYAYPQWKGAFYPRDLPASDFLRFYAERLSSVELNNTFYRFPAEALLDGWRASTPDGFCFAVKAHQKITHQGRLKGVEEFTRDFVERCTVLGQKLGPILFQLPPYLRRDDERLAGFLASSPRGFRYTVEFRHESWFDEPIFQRLREANVALCIAEMEEGAAPPRMATADFCYLRLRKEAYEPRELREWRAWIDEQLSGGRDIFAYLKHDEEGGSPELALRLLEARGADRAKRRQPRAGAGRRKR